jgi:predicted RND superfamily exporter protein
MVMYMKEKAILCLLGVMLFVTILHFVLFALYKSDEHSTKKRSKRKKRNSCDWIKQRRQDYWREQAKSRNEMELSEITTRYIQTMLLLLCLLFLVIISL